MCVEQIPGVAYRVVTWPGSGTRSFIVDLALASESALEAVEQLLRDANAVVVTQRVFTSMPAHAGRLEEALQGRWKATGPPVRLTGNGSASCSTQPHVQIEALSGVSVNPVEHNGSIAGAVYEANDVKFCHLSGIEPHDLSASRGEQAASVFRQMESALAAAGMTTHDVVRTWFFIDRILDWYGEFNRIRSAQFSEWGLTDRMLPASTGVGTANSAGAALLADVFAVQSRGGQAEVSEVASPLQCPATAYASSFSRASGVKLSGQRRLYISGTASIEPGGDTAHAGDLDRQIALTMKVTGEILRSRDMTWSDATRGIAWFSDISRMPAFEEYCRRHDLRNLPIAAASADICRDDLLFELELDAVAT